MNTYTLQSHRRAAALAYNAKASVSAPALLSWTLGLSLSRSQHLLLPPVSWNIRRALPHRLCMSYLPE